MTFIVRHKAEEPGKDPISLVQKEIKVLKTELDTIQKKLLPLEEKIRTDLGAEISRIRELSELYKRQKALKKAKRLEQKKRGKNYKEPKQVIKNRTKGKPAPIRALPEQKEIRRLYKEAVLQTHPDKISYKGEEDKIEQATEVTSRLNSIYKSGDLEELIEFYQSVIQSDGNKNSDHFSISADPTVRLASLERKREEIKEQLEKIRKSYLYQVLTNYENPLNIVPELRIQFDERIKQLEKRTRKG